MAIRKFEAGRIITLDLDHYIGTEGTIFYDEFTAEMRLSDGVTPGGIPIYNGGGGGGAGPRGPSGPSGPSGARGAQGNSGPSGPSGAKGPQGPSGPIGPSGAQGNPGARGADGVTGPTGASGPSGTRGADGVTGPSGPGGASGPSGTRGLDGATGPSGADGVTGPTGASGPSGTRGLDGATGPSGPSGAKGDPGANAETFVGDVPPITATTGTMWWDTVSGRTYIYYNNGWEDANPSLPGPTGPSGAQGEIGPTGPSGAQGEIGPTGPSGADGVTGPSGADGVTGPSGAKGDTGPTGPSGASNIIVSDTAPLDQTVGSVWYDTVSGRTYIYYEGTWVDTNPGTIGPIGPTGAQGSTGPTGARGDTGTIAVSTTSTDVISPVTDLRFDPDSGFTLQNPGTGVAKVSIATATSSTLGVIKAGNYVSVTNSGVLNVSKGAGINKVVDISDVNSTTLDNGALLVYNAGANRWDTTINLVSEVVDGGEF